MPLYTFRYKPDHSITVEVLRSFDEYEVRPTPEEIEGAGYELVGGMELDDQWERVMHTGIQVNYAQGRGKGNWGKM